MRWLSLCLVLSLVAQPSHASLLCTQLLLTAKSAVGFPQDPLEFDYSRFLDRREDFVRSLNEGTSIDFNAVSDSVDRVALLDAIGKTRELEFLSLERILQSGTQAQKLELDRIVTKFDFVTGLSALKAEQALGELYLLVHTSSRAPGKFWDRFTLKMAIKKRIESSLVKKELLSAFQDLDLIRDPSALERMSQWRANHRVLESIVIAGVLNFLSWHYFSMIAHIPGIKLEPRRQLPMELIEKIKRGGFDSVYNDVRPYFKNTEVFNTVWKSAQVAYSTFFVVYGAVIVFQSTPELSRMTGLTSVSERAVARFQEETFQADEVRNRLFNGWTNSFYKLEGRLPDPIADQELWEKAWNRTMNATPEQLKVDYSPRK